MIKAIAIQNSDLEILVKNIESNLLGISKDQIVSVKYNNVIVQLPEGTKLLYSALILYEK